MKYLCALVLAVMVLLPATVWGQVGRGSMVALTPHNLSAGGPGTVRASSETEICIFCHAPHNAAPLRPLWNRALPVSSYKIYTSNSLKALPGQPTGSSKLCLSCHDGTIALGSVTSRTQQIQMAGGVITLPAGATNLGTDLSDDHPISFVYDAALVTKNPKLKDPALLPSTVRLDENRNVQCTTCHDAHNNQYGNFLVLSNQNSALCNTCHTMTTVANSDVIQHTTCDNCHQTHTAPSGPYLLVQSKVSTTCLTCHSGAGGANQGSNVNAAVTAGYPHDTGAAVNLSNHIPNNVDCKDCHEPHTMVNGGSAVAAPGKAVSLGKIDGVNIAGAAVNAAQYEYEVCFKCHADNAATLTRNVPRMIAQTNMRLELTSDAVSFHPVAFKGKNTNVPSLRPPYTTNSLILCTDCHGSENSKKAGGSGPNGPHGSANPYVLLARCDTADLTPYSTTAYALCFICHDNTKVVANTGPFPLHSSHVDTDKSPCSACHDSHGVSSAQGTAQHNFGLVNFDTSIVSPDDTTHQISYTHTGVTGQNTCTLKCHGHNHNASPY